MLKTVYIRELATPKADAHAVLAKPPFLLKFMQQTASSAVNEGSLHSSALKVQDATAMPLSELRQLIKAMSVILRCTRLRFRLSGVAPPLPLSLI